MRPGITSRSEHVQSLDCAGGVLLFDPVRYLITVTIDTNKDGLVDAGEPGLADVTVRLSDTCYQRACRPQVPWCGCHTSKSCLPPALLALRQTSVHTWKACTPNTSLNRDCRPESRFAAAGSTAVLLACVQIHACSDYRHITVAMTRLVQKALRKQCFDSDADTDVMSGLWL